MGGEVGPCESLLLQDRMLIGPVLHKCYAGNSSCFEFTGATAMSFLEDRKFHDTHQSTDSDTLYTVSCPWTLERAIYPSHLGRSVLNTSRQHLNSIVRGKRAFLSSLMSVSSQRSQSHQHCPKKMLIFKTTNRMKYCPGNLVNPVLSLLSRSQLNQQGNDLSRLAVTVTIKKKVGGKDNNSTDYTDTNSPNDLIKELLEIMIIL